MRVVVPASIAVLLLLLGCASTSQPESLTGGPYAIVIDPRLEARHAFHDTLMLHNAVKLALTDRLPMASTVAEAGTIITLKPGRTRAQLYYDISHDGKTIRRRTPMGLMPSGTPRSIREDLESQRRAERARGDTTIAIPTHVEPRAIVASDPAGREAVLVAAHRIADQIVHDLARH
jgi:hypothetical protein